MADYGTADDIHGDIQAVMLSPVACRILRRGSRIRLRWNAGIAGVLP